MGMTEKDLRVRYKNTVFGFLWVIINPLMQMIVIGFVFRFFIKEPIANYYLYLLVGLLVWNFFSLSLSKATPSIVNERNLIKKAKFQREVIPLSIILSNFTHLLVAFAILLIPIILSGLFSIFNIPTLLIAIVLLFVFTSGLSLLTSALNVRFRDISFFVQAILIVWFYATPVVYSIFVIPHNLIWIWRLNPMTSIIQLFQNALVSAPAPGPAMLLSNVSITILIAFFGIWTFKKESKNFDDWV
jgi:ABC-2 type transport system permease protein